MFPRPLIAYHPVRVSLHHSVAVALALSLTACSNLPDYGLHQCGNHIVESNNGEDCDNRGPGCGAPGTDAACRFVCPPDARVACPSGYVCGTDRICRKPLGTYTLGPSIGTSDERMALADVDGDGHPDLIGRTYTSLDLWRNNGKGSLSLLATGPVLSESGVNFQSIPPIATVLPPANADTPLVALANQFVTGGIDLYTWKDGALSPILLAATGYTGLGDPHRLIGAVMMDDGTTAAIYLSGYDLWALSTTGPLDPLNEAKGNAELATHCGLRTALGNIASVDAHVRQLAHGALLSLVADRVCVGAIDGQGTVQLQDLQADGFLAQNGLSLPQTGTSALLDVDGNGLADLLVAVKTAAGDLRKVVWLQTATGWLPPVALPASLSGETTMLGAADFDGDGRDDLVGGGTLYVNRTMGREGSFTVGGDFSQSYEYFGPTNVIAADFNADQHADFIYWPADTVAAPTLELHYCFGDGSARRFTCGPAMPTSPFTNVAVGDINGDSINDIVLSGPGLGLVLGRALAAPLPLASEARPLPGTTLAGVALAAQPTQIAQQILVDLSDGSIGQSTIAIGSADATGVPQFGIPMNDPLDLTVGMYTGAEPSLAVIAPLPTMDLGITLLNKTLPGTAIDLGPGTDRADDSRAMFCAIDPHGPPLMCGKTATGTFYARLVVNVLYPELHALPAGKAVADIVQAVVDLDGDGQPEAAQQVLFGDGTALLRVLHVDATGAVQVVDTPITGCDIEWILLDVPPLDGHLDLQCGINLYVQKEGFKFAAAQPDQRLTIHDEQGHDARGGLLWRGTRDFNQDGLPDAVVRAADGFFHIAFADVVRR
jgi:hypothetical protein